MHCLIESLGRRAAYNTPVLTQASGCVCCKVRDDLAAALKRLAVELAATSLTTSEASAEAETGSGGGGGGGGGAIEAVLIETSGLSEVRPTSPPCISRGRVFVEAVAVEAMEAATRCDARCQHPAGCSRSA